MAKVIYNRDVYGWDENEVSFRYENARRVTIRKVKINGWVRWYIHYDEDEVTRAMADVPFRTFIAALMFAHKKGWMS